MTEVEEYFDLFFYRPLAFLLVKIIYRTNITPNQITYTSILAGIVAGCFYAQGTPYYFSVGALFFALYNIIDCSDGMLARLKKNGTHAGRIVDGFADYIATVSVFIGIGIGFAGRQSNPEYWWLLLVAAGLSNIIQSSLVDYYRNRFLDYVQRRKSTFEEGLDSFREEYNAIKDRNDKWLDRIILNLYFRYSAFKNNLAVKKKREKLFKATPEDYYKRNKTAVRFWVMIGPTAQITTVIICSLINRFDIFCWVMIIGFNGVAAIMRIVQRNIDMSFKEEVLRIKY